MAKSKSFQSMGISLPKVSMLKSSQSAKTAKTSQSSPQWEESDKDAVTSAVTNIIEGGDGGISEYNPNLFNKVQIGLKYASDKAHGTASDELEYMSMPEDIKDSLSTIATAKLNPNGSLSRDAIKENAKLYEVNLNDDELNMLEKNPGLPSAYLEVKNASSFVDPELIHATIESLIDESSNKNFTKQHLKNRLQNLLRLNNDDNLNYLVNDLRGDLKDNTLSKKEKYQGIINSYPEFNGFDDRTWQRKAKETWDSTSTGIWRAFANTASFLWDNAPEMADTYVRTFNPPLLWAKMYGDYQSQKMIEDGRTTYFGKGFFEDMKQTKENIDKPLEDFADEISTWGEAGQKPDLSEDIKKANSLYDTSYYAMGGDMAGETFTEVLETIAVGKRLKGAMLDVGLTPEVINNSGWAKFFYNRLMNTAEGSVYSVANNKAENLVEDVTSWNIIGGLFFEALPWAVDKLGGKLAENLVGTSTFKAMIETAREGGNTAFNNARKKIISMIVERLPNNFLKSGTEEGVQTVKEALDLLTKDYRKSLKLIGGEYENKNALEILKELFGRGEKLENGYKGKFKSDWYGVSEEYTEEGIDKLWNRGKDMYKSGKKTFTAEELGFIEWLGNNSQDMYLKDALTMKGGKGPREWASHLIPLRDAIDDIAKNQSKSVSQTVENAKGMISKLGENPAGTTAKELSNLGTEVLGEDTIENGVKNIHDTRLEMSTLTRLKNGLENRIGETFYSRLRSRGTIWGGALAGGATALSEGVYDPDPYLVSIAVIIAGAFAHNPTLEMNGLKQLGVLQNFSRRLTATEISNILDINEVANMSVEETAKLIDESLYYDNAEELKKILGLPTNSSNSERKGPQFDTSKILPSDGAYELQSM